MGVSETWVSVVSDTGAGFSGGMGGGLSGQGGVGDLAARGREVVE